MRPIQRPLAMILLSVGLCSCLTDRGFNPLTRPVTGSIIVDGKPAAGVMVVAHPTHPDQDHPATAQGITDAKGHFELYTYDPGDGVLEGEHKLTFTWPDNTGRDRLHGHYTKTTDSLKTFTVKLDHPMDLGKCELKTK